MHDLYLVIYAKRDTEIIYRLVNWLPPYDNHSYTSMGWYIVDIQQFYNGQFHSLEEYKILKKIDHDKWWKKEQKKIEKENKKYYRRKAIVRKLFKKYL